MENEVKARWWQRLLRLVLAVVLAVVALRWLPPPTSAFMLRAAFLAKIEGRKDFVLRHDWVDLDEIAPAAGLAVVAAEDQLFFSHHGFDFDAMVSAYQRNQTGRRIRGGSTLSQQTAKNLFLYPARSFVRKGLEAGFTALLELFWPKARILEVYLNIAQFGDGIYGVEAASRAFFNKPAMKLSSAEAALLAASLPNPLKLRVDRPSGYVLKRRDWILRQMGQLGEKLYPLGHSADAGSALPRKWL
jgi:monofunctional biosynthetic peptidoglycan transglycosylase